VGRSRRTAEQVPEALGGAGGKSRGDSVVTPFAGAFDAIAQTPWFLVVSQKPQRAQCTKEERLPKLDVAGSSPVSGSIFKVGNRQQLLPLHSTPLSGSPKPAPFGWAYVANHLNVTAYVPEGRWTTPIYRR